LWKTDGTPAGTVEVFHAQSTRLSPLTDLTSVGNTLLFVTYERDENGFALSTQLWKSDGTPAGTTRLATWPQPTNFSWTLRSIVLGNAMIFQVMNGNELQLWRSDGTADGTTMVKNFARPGITINWDPDLLASAGVVGNTLYFIDSERDTDASGNTVTIHDLWKTD